jgi:hypothetical protein
LERRV